MAEICILAAFVAASLLTCVACQAQETMAASFFLFGRVLLPAGNWNAGACELEIFVKIGEHVWEQPLDSAHYVFQVPAGLFSGMIGILGISLRRHRQLWETVWTQPFGVEGLPGSFMALQELDADVSQISPLLEKCSSWQDSAIVSITGNVHKKYDSAVSLPLFSHSAHEDLSCSASYWHEHTCPCSGRSTSQAATDTDVRSTAVVLFLGSPLAEEAHSSRSTSLQLLEQDDTNHRAGVLQEKGIRFPLLAGSIFIILASVLYRMRSAWIHDCKTGPVSASRSRSLRKAPWQVRMCCPNPGGTVRGQSSRSRNVNTLLCSGEECLQDAWEEAELRLSEIASSRSEGCCFYYNCYSQSCSSHTKHMSHPGKWNRDNTGRLIKTPS